MISLMFALMLAAEAPQQAAAVEAPVAEAKPAKAKKICREDPNITGTRMKKKICLTEVEWAKRNEGKSVGDLKAIGGR